MENSADSNTIDFKTARENSGLTLKQLFERTRISVVNLEAIENGDFHLLPVPIYTRNFIKTYARALGVDSKPVLQRYENYLQTLQTQQEEEQQTAEQPPDASLLDLFRRYKAHLWTLLIIIVLAGVVFFVNTINQPAPEMTQLHQPIPKAASPAVPAQNTFGPENLPASANLTKPAEADHANPGGAGPKLPDQKAAAGQIPAASGTTAAVSPAGKPDIGSLIDDEESTSLIIYATEETWIRIQTDDKEPFQVLLKPGEKISRKAARFNMDIGNAGGVRIQFDGKNLENLGKTGQVIHLRLP